MIPEYEATPVPERATSATSDIDLLIELNAHRLLRGAAILDASECVESVWGDGHQSLWAKYEPFLIAGPDGVGKTTILQQLALSVIEVKGPSFLGMPVERDERRVLYLACDRPAQALRSFRRMTTEDDRRLLDERLAIWRGPLPFDIARNPEGLLALTRNAGCGVVMIDSLKDVAADLSNQETGQGVNMAYQMACAEGVDVAALHHQRKAQNGGPKPRHLADVYGSRWLTAGCGSVAMLWGDAGDPVIEFEHLKQPDEPIGPLNIVHDHLTGTSTVIDHVDAYTIVANSTKGVSVAEVAGHLYGNTERNAQEKARRSLNRLFSQGKIHREEGEKGGPHGSKAAAYFPISRRVDVPHLGE